jgi:hypothetical protein
MSSDPSQSSGVETSNAGAAKPRIDVANAQALFEQLLQRQNFPLALIGGFVAAVGGGLAWAAVTVSTGMQIGWMAVGIGFLVGFVIRKLGKGLTKKFGIAGGALSLFGCLLGNFLALCGLVSKIQGLPVVATTLAYIQDPASAFELIQGNFSPIDLLFYGIAVYEGYKFSFREVTDEDLSQITQ